MKVPWNQKVQTITKPLSLAWIEPKSVPPHPNILNLQHWVQTLHQLGVQYLHCVPCSASKVLEVRLKTLK